MSAPTRVSPLGFLKLSSDVASFWGFKPLREVEKTLPPGTWARGAHQFAAAAEISALRAASLSEPVLAYYVSASPTHIPGAVQSPHLSSREVGEFGLHVAGVAESVAEVLIIKTLATILSEWGSPLVRVRINALGDKDSKLRFTRELSGYLRRHESELGECCKNRQAAEPLAPTTCSSSTCREVLEGGPRAVNFLSEKSRSHFREVLEHLENLSLPYELDDLLLGDEREPHILFALDLEGADATVLGSYGGRFDDFARKLAGKKEGSAVHASLYFRKKGVLPSTFRGPVRPPRIYFVQLGMRAKLQGLVVTEALRRAQIPILQSFNSSSLSPQLEAAKLAGVSHLIIMGQREALDGTVIVRAMGNSSQQSVPLSTLPRYLKALH